MVRLNQDYSKIIHIAGKPISLQTLLGLWVILLWAIFSIFLGGWDFLVSVRGDTLSGIPTTTYNPYPAYWFFYPFAILPPKIGYLIWNLANAAGFLYALRYWKTNPLAFAVTIPCFWNFYGGQYEGFFASAFALGLQAHPLLAGFGLFVLTFKPQVGLMPILYVLYKRRDWRLLILPVFLYGLSFIVYGWWIPQWYGHLQTGFERDLITGTRINLFPWGFLSILLLVRYASEPKIWLLIGSLIVPYYSVYSLATLFTLKPPPWWFNLAMWGYYLIPAFLPSLSYLHAWGFWIPIGLLGLEMRGKIFQNDKSKSPA